MNTSQVIIVNGEELKYTERLWYGKPYIITYLSDYPTKVVCYFNQIVHFIDRKRQGGVIGSNCLSQCNRNAEIILGGLTIEPQDGVGIMGRCVSKNKIILCGNESDYSHEEITEVYGNQLGSIGMSFHALSYISFGLCSGGEIHIAVDTTTTSNIDKYMVQLYVARTSEELETLLRLRYKYQHYDVCDIYTNPCRIVGHRHEQQRKQQQQTDN